MSLPVQIDHVKPEQLHDVWDWVRGRKASMVLIDDHRTFRYATGIERIIAKVKPDWKPEDLYASARAGLANLYIVKRGDRKLGFFAIYRQNRPFSGRAELFLWCAYTIPIREREPDDNLDEAIRASIEFMYQHARANSCDSVVMLSTRKGLERFGFTRTFTTWRIALT